MAACPCGPGRIALPVDLGHCARHNDLMLPPAHRLRRSREFQGAVRSGVRAGSSTVVLHLRPPDEVVHNGHEPTKIGLIVSRSVGPAVTRTRVKRRLRHLAIDRLHDLPPGSRLVLRALPAAASATYDELGHDLDRGLRRVMGQRPGSSAVGS